jgi:CDP-glycerol glycerophosphotransferase
MTDRAWVTDEPSIVFEGTGPAPSLVLAGAHATQAALVTATDDGWTATVPLLASAWGSGPLPLPSGRYRVETDATLAETLVPGVARVRVEPGEVVLSPPLADDELGPDNQRRLERAYRRSRLVLPDAVFFESFYGRTAGDNPRALDAAIARARPDVRRYWGVVDASVPVPAGAVAVVEGSRAWWRARAGARLLVVNDWLRGRYRRRKHQTVLQTWHGTPLKRLALDRGPALRARLAALRESRRWDVLLAQGPEAAGWLTSAYGFRGEVWEEGYPRNDSLATGDAAEARASLGLDPRAVVALYAPTWRDDRPEHVTYLDPASFARNSGATVLVRGHSRSLERGEAARGRRVLDVTTHPDLATLMLAADVLVTDYSSVMFDFPVTGKPILFYVPDLEHYRDDLRGFYFDYTSDAPGPLLRTPEEAVDATRGLRRVQAEYAEPYAAWRARFAPHDDGDAADRVVRRLIDRGAL